MSEHTLAELVDVTRTYGGVPVLDEVSVSITSGVTVVVGPNGSGKSTLLGILAGAVEPVDGEVRYAHENGADAGKRIGYLPQRVPFRDAFTARETLGFYAALADGDPDAALADVGLADAGDKRVAALSGGMRRLLGIAQATLGNPAIAVLDEPTSGLDPAMRERAFRAAAARANDDTAVVVSSHDLDLVDSYADEIVVLDRGRVAAAGSVERLLTDHGVENVTSLFRAVVGDGASAVTDAGDGDSDDGPENGDATAPESVHVAGVSDR
ncbi:ABC transporter [Halorubrum californiense DSM 19288]|uniref:ABC transporter n=1 Tax=Halorubrum californiense DSM 19288 TaxID=1227465 RepID=M0EI37_9EURY|nr:MULTISPECIES: ABC transporter ATP-binding protein [Halorubrum]ELZ47420.1 ABC transporter [Halorubrum californiense DSM 19288]TKX72205.1 ABC transporter ATP-binding protein [Halorubrum sp. GN11GM_10-3_MGM]